MRTLKLISRVSAWLLLAGVILLGLSGWGMTHPGFVYQSTFGLIDRGVANDIHLRLQTPVTFILLLHVLTRIRISFDRRWSTNQWILNAILIVTGLVIMALVIYFEYFVRF